MASTDRPPVVFEPLHLTDDQVLMADEHILVVNKPRGYPIHATRDPKRPHLEGAVKAWSEMQQSGSGATLTVVHRLDVWTSGAVLFARTDKARKVLARLFEDRRVHKSYEAVCSGAPAETSGELKHYLARQRLDGRDVMVSVRSGGKVALTRYRLLGSSGAESLIEMEPMTGRTHQLRVQAADAGWPIVGDDVYGAAVNEGGVVGQLLHACRLGFDHPLSGERLLVEAPAPSVFAQRADPLRTQPKDA